MNTNKTVIKTNCFGITVILDDNEGGVITSDLKGGEEMYDNCMDTLESMILAHAIAGIDITEPSYLEGVGTAVEAATNNLPEKRECFITTDEHPDGHDANATLSCLSDGLACSIAVNIDGSLGGTQQQLSDRLSKAFEGCYDPAISSIQIQIGCEDE